MAYLLDSNFCISLLRDKNARGWARLNAESPAEVFLCAVVEAELFCGAAKARDPQRATFDVLGFVANFTSVQFDSAAARVYATVRSDLEAK